MPEHLNWSEAPAIPGLTMRTWRGHEDLEQLAATGNADRLAYGIDQRMSAQELAKTGVPKSGFEPDQDIHIVEVNGQMIGWKNVFWLDEKDNTRTYRHWGALIPEWRGKGIGTAMIRHSERMLVEKAQAHRDTGEVAPGKAFLRAYVQKAQPDVQAILTALGYAPERHFYYMVRPDLENIPEVALPPGIEVRPATTEQFHQIWLAQTDAFSEHWGASDTVREEDYEWWLARPYLQPELWMVAWDGNEIAGMILNYIPTDENEQLGRRRGYTEEICVRKPWRGRGLARALHAQSLRLLHAHGMHDAALHVDAQNESGALRLYESMGFQKTRHSVSYSKSMLVS